MRKTLSDIREGVFANRWIEENRAGRAEFDRMRQRARDHQIEAVGENLRGLMSWKKQGQGQAATGDIPAVPEQR